MICRERWPEGPDEFNPALSRNLLAQDVLIELWGEREQGMALIQYAVLPVRIRAGAHLPGVYASAYSFDAAAASETLFRDARELQAFTALALGFRALEQAHAASVASDRDKVARSASFNDARSYFCEAERLLSEAEAKSGRVRARSAAVESVDRAGERVRRDRAHGPRRPGLSRRPEAAARCAARQLSAGSELSAPAPCPGSCC